MSVRPIEFSGMIQNTHEVTTNRNNELQKPMVQQEQVSVANQQAAELSLSQVAGSEESSRQTFNPEDGGDGSGYQGNRNKTKKEAQEKKKKPEGKIVMKGQQGGFNATV